MKATKNVYVVRLNEAVLEDSFFRDKNPHYVPGMPCVYVGRTGHSPEERFRQHKNRYRANRFVRDYGEELLPDLYEKYNPMVWEEVEARERALADELRKLGYGVWQN